MTTWKTLGRRLLTWLRRRWLLVLVILAFVVFLIAQYNNVVRFLGVLLGGQLAFLLVAVALQILYYAVYAVLYQVGFQTVEVDGGALELLPVLLASIFLKVVVPSGGVSAVAVFVDDATRRGQSAARAAEGSLLVLVADLTTMMPFILYGLGFLAFRGVVYLYQILGSILFLLFATAMAGVLLLGRLQPARLRAVLAQVQDTVNGIAARFRRPPILQAEWAERNAAECIGAACNIAEHPRPLTRTLLVALVVHAINIASLYMVALAYRQPAPVGAVVAAYSMDIIFSVVSIIPLGIGVAEGVIALVFTSLGVPVEQALVISVAFRGLNVWLPLLLGFFFLPRVRSFGAGE